MAGSRVRVEGLEVEQVALPLRFARVGHVLVVVGAVCHARRSSDLEQLVLFGGEQLVDVADLLVRDLLELFLDPV